MSKNKISVVINTKNACQLVPHHRFEATLASVGFADQLVIVDMNSEDDTKKIASQHTSEIYDFDDIGFVEPARNFAISKAESDWILIVDADEEIPLELAEKLQQLARGDATADAYFIARKNMVFGTWYHFAGWWPDYQLRFFRKNTVVWSDKIHSVPQISGKSDKLPDIEKLAIIHHSYQSISQFIERMNRYTTHDASQRGKRPINPSNIVKSFDAELLSRIFKHEGIRGGAHGVALSYLQSFYEVAVILKQWELAGFPENFQIKPTLTALKNHANNLEYWLNDFEIQKSSGSRKWILKLKRKLGI